MSKPMPKKLHVLLSLTCACFVGCGPKTVEERAEAGDAGAQQKLAHMYYKGNGVPQDYKKAVKWIRKAADQGIADAQHNLAGMYGRGDGVPQDYKEAIKWYRKAADQGHALAQSKLGAIYYLDEGIPQDYVQSYAWLSLGVANGDASAKRAKYLVAKLMTPEQIARGQELARELDKKIKATK